MAEGGNEPIQIDLNLSSSHDKKKAQPQKLTRLPSDSTSPHQKLLEVKFHQQKDHQDNYNKKVNMAALDSVVSLFKELKTEWAKQTPNLKKCGNLLEQLKIGMTKLVFLPTGNSIASKQELLLARDILEIGVEYSVAMRDIPQFERYMAQLKCYYFDYKNEIGESQFKYQLLGLNLLFLLSQNRVADFHTELELLPADIIHTNKFIKHSLALEQNLMEGSYNKIFLAFGNVPAECYKFFMDILLETVRNEIAACLEKAYEKISIAEAARRLNLKSKNEIIDFGKKKNWKLTPDNFYYFANDVAKPKEPLPSIELAEQAIFYARELEMIV